MYPDPQVGTEVTNDLGDVVVPRLPDDAPRRDVGLDEMTQRVVAVDSPLHASGRPECDQGARLELQLVRPPPEQLVVLRVCTRPTGLDVVHAEPVELFRDPQLVLDRERDPFELRPVPKSGVINFDTCFVALAARRDTRLAGARDSASSLRASGAALTAA